MNKLKIFSALCILVFIVILFNRFYLIPPLSADSWSYFEISKTIFNDFYKFTTYRSYENPSLYGSSFPPLWPVLIGILNALFDLGPRAGVITNFLLLPFICLSLEGLALKLCNIRFLGVLTFFVVLSDASFIDEVIGGRCIPLQILLLLNMFCLLVSKEAIGKGGLLLGLCLMNRFDALVLLPISFFYLILVRTSVVNILRFLSVFCLTISPWIIYSLSHFSSLWKTDNSFVAKAVHKAYVTDWYPAQIVTLKEDFYTWLSRIISNIYPLCVAYIKGYGGSISSIFLSISVLFFSFLVLRLALKTPKACVGETHSKLILGAFQLFVLLNLFSFAPYLLTGYMDLRYFAFVRIIFVLLLLGGITLLFNYFVDIQKLVNGSIVLLIPSLIYLSYLHFPKVEISSEKDPLSPAWIGELSACLNKEANLGVTLFSGLHNPFQFGAISGNKSACLPGNFDTLGVQDRAKFMRTFGITHIVSAKDKDLLSSELGLKLERVECGEPLYKISEFM